jgi:excisionase family DNA binding protein
MQDQRYISLEQASIYTNISTRTLRRRIATGELTAYRQGSRLIRLDVRELDAIFVAVPPDGGASNTSGTVQGRGGERQSQATASVGSKAATPKELAAARRKAAAAEKLEAHIAKVVAEAPPLSPAQRDRLAVLFRNGGGLPA